MIDDVMKLPHLDRPTDRQREKVSACAGVMGKESMVNRCIDPRMLPGMLLRNQIDESRLYTFSSSDKSNNKVTRWMLLRHVIMSDSRSTPEKYSHYSLEDALYQLTSSG